jgi:hypothetical protein
MKKGMELSLNTVIIAAILLITAIVIIMIFSGSAGDFVSGIFGTKCAGKLRALCTPQGPDDDINKDGISDSASFTLDVDDSGVAVVTGKCADEKGAASTDYKGACKKWSEEKKKADSNKVIAGR